MTQTPIKARRHTHTAAVVPLQSSPLPADVTELAARALADGHHDDRRWALVEDSWKDTFRRLAHRVLTDVISEADAPDRVTSPATPRQVADMTDVATSIVDALTPQFRTSRHPAAPAARASRIRRVQTALLHAVSLHTP